MEWGGRATHVPRGLLPIGSGETSTCYLITDRIESLTKSCSAVTKTYSLGTGFLNLTANDLELGEKLEMPNAPGKINFDSALLSP